MNETESDTNSLPAPHQPLIRAATKRLHGYHGDTEMRTTHHRDRDTSGFWQPPCTRDESWGPFETL